ncbi:MAG: tetratricopeptide repeat protein, partial [Verrucomicrobia bacterium]|nr:tetratricopeptide repeat protein [Verrucomicrobiota bacterium]
NTVLLFVLLLRLMENEERTDALWPAAFVAAVFAWHPLHVESVAWIAERKDVLSGFFGLLTLLGYVRYVRQPKARRAKRHLWFALTCIFFALGLMSKPMLVTLPFVMLLLDFWPLKRFDDSGVATFKRLLAEKVPFFALSAVSCVVTFLAQRHGGAVMPLKAVSLVHRLENAPLAYFEYLEKAFWPARLAVIYPLPKWIAPLHAMAAAGALAVITVAAWIWRRRAPYALVGWLWFMGMLVPVIGLVQVGGAALADRYTYLPSIGIFVAVAFGVRDGARRFGLAAAIVPVAAAAVLAGCLILTHRQLGYWRSDIGLFSHAIAVTKDNEIAHLNLGVALEQAGHKTQAMEQYRMALKIAPDSLEGHNNLANLLDDAGETDKAMAQYEDALRLSPHYVAALNNFGTMLVEQRRFGDAMKLYAQSEEAAPRDWHAPWLMGKALLKQGRDAEALASLQHAADLEPDNVEVLAFLAEVLASDENSRVRNGPSALALASRANTLTGGDQPAVLDVLAMANAESGRFANAQQETQSAITLSRKYGITNEAPALQKRLELYRDHHPFRQSFTGNAVLKKSPADGLKPALR